MELFVADAQRGRVEELHRYRERYRNMEHGRQKQQQKQNELLLVWAKSIKMFQLLISLKSNAIAFAFSLFILLIYFFFRILYFVFLIATSACI